LVAGFMSFHGAMVPNTSKVGAAIAAVTVPF
jgi:hypothetical protein